MLIRFLSLFVFILVCLLSAPLFCEAQNQSDAAQKDAVISTPQTPLSPTEKDSLIDLAGSEIYQSARLSQTGYAVELLGALCIALGTSMSVSATTTGTNKNNRGSGFIVLGGALSLSGYLLHVAATTPLRRAGAHLNSIYHRKKTQSPQHKQKLM